MKFNKLRLTGFKSFFESTDLHIEAGLSGVSGVIPAQAKPSAEVRWKPLVP